MLNVASEKGGALSIFREAICNHVLSNASGIGRRPVCTAEA